MNARSKTEAGFTIVETLIFLAISGMMFVLAINAMGGKQQQTEFQTSVGTLRSELNDTFADVSTGNYENQYKGITYQCQGTPSGPAIEVANTPLLGTCTVIGEIIEFGNNPPQGQTYYTIPVFGCTYIACNTGSGPATDITDSLPYVDASMSDHIYDKTNMPFGLEIKNQIPAFNTPGAFAIFSFTSFDSSAGSNLTGSGHVELFKLPGMSYSTSHVPTDVASVVNGGVLINCLTDQVCDKNTTAEQPINPTGGISFCVDSGTSDDQSALFTLGGSGGATTSVTDQIFGGDVC